MMSRIVRKENPPPMTGANGYAKAREHLRLDFSHRCAYCMIHEERVDHEDGFQIDHFKPVSKVGPVNSYENLYWSCAACNRIKGDRWPDDAEMANGYRFADPCNEQNYGFYFIERDDGTLEPLSPCGEYHVLRLRLNRKYRRDRRIERNELLIQLQRVSDLVERLKAKEGSDSTLQEAFDEIMNKLQSIKDDLDIAIPRIGLMSE